MSIKINFVVPFITSVLMLGAVSAPLNLIRSADALKEQGVPPSQYGSATKDIVCGDKLCSEVKKETPKKDDQFTVIYSVATGQ